MQRPCPLPLSSSLPPVPTPRLQLSVYATLRWYVEQEASGAESRMRSLPPRDLLFQLPNLQRLQRRLLDCMPRGAATHDPVVLVSEEVGKHTGGREGGCWLRGGATATFCWDGYTSKLFGRATETLAHEYKWLACHQHACIITAAFAACSTL